MAALSILSLVALLAATHPSPTPGPGLTTALAPLAGFTGAWECQGVFPRTGRRITSTLSFTPDLQGTWLVLRQDDRPPNRYHALGMWGADTAKDDFVMLLADDFGGHREFRTPGWRRDSLAWTLVQSPRDTLSQRFTYGRTGASTMFVTFAVARARQPWTTVDSLACTRA